MPPLHPDLAPLAALLGRWTGHGHGVYPTIEPFDYDEEITFTHVGKPFLAYSQRTRSVDVPPLPLHAETGYWRVPEPGRAELVLAHPTGVSEIDEGTITVEPDGSLVIELNSTSVALTATAKEVEALRRRFHVRGDTIDYTLSMAAVGLPLQHHLAATLRRDSEA